MEDNPLGELFKDKLSQREFEMKDAYWKDAEQLIINHNKRRRNRRVLFFLMAILLITTFLAGLFDYYSGKVETEKSLVFNNVATSEANKGGLENSVSKSESTVSVESGTEKPIGLSSEVASEKLGDGPDDIPLPEDLPKNEEGSTEKPIGLSSEVASEKLGDGPDDIPPPEDLPKNEEGGTEKPIGLSSEIASEKLGDGLDDVLPPEDLPKNEEEGTEKPIGLSSEVASEKLGDGLDDVLPLEDLPENEEGGTENPNDLTVEATSEKLGDYLDDVLPADDLHENEEGDADKSVAVNEDAAPKINKDTLPTSTSADPITGNLTGQSDIIRKDSIKSSLSLNLYGSGFYVNKFLATTDQSFDNHVDRRTKEEQSILSYGAGVELNYHFDNWLISAGVAFSNLGEKTNYSPNVREQTDAIISDNSYWRVATFTYWITDSIGNPELVQIVDSNYIEVINSIDTTYTITDSSVAEQNGSTKLTYIEIPVLIGYDLPLNKLRLSIRTGLSLGYLAMSKGYYLNRSNEQLLNIGTTPNQFNSFTLSYLLRIGTNYKLNESIDLFVEPAFKLNLNSVLEQQYDISQKYYSIGLNLGVNYRL